MNHPLTPICQSSLAVMNFHQFLHQDVRLSLVDTLSDFCTFGTLGFNTWFIVYSFYSDFMMKGLAILVLNNIPIFKPSESNRLPVKPEDLTGLLIANRLLHTIMSSSKSLPQYPWLTSLHTKLRKGAWSTEPSCSQIFPWDTTMSTGNDGNTVVKNWWKGFDMKDVIWKCNNYHEPWWTPHFKTQTDCWIECFLGNQWFIYIYKKERAHSCSWRCVIFHAPQVVLPAKKDIAVVFILQVAFKKYFVSFGQDAKLSIFKGLIQKKHSPRFWSMRCR